MPKRKSQKFPAYQTQQLFFSPAFRSLKPASKDILTMLYYNIDMASKTKNGKYTPCITNRCDIRLPYEEITRYLGYKDKAIWTAFKEMLSNGFIKIVKQGGGAKGDMNVYGITEDWRKWEPGMVIREIKRNSKRGWQAKTNAE